MSPEQAKGRRLTNAATVGVWLRALRDADRTPPFAGEDVSETLRGAEASPIGAPCPRTRLRRFEGSCVALCRRIASGAWPTSPMRGSRSRKPAANSGRPLARRSPRRNRHASANICGPRRRCPLSWAAAAVATGMFVAPAPEARVTRFHISPPEGARIEFGEPLSPDGRLLAFAAASQEQTLIWICRLDSVTVYPLPGTDGATRPFWSPDSKYIAFFARGKLNKIPVGGGEPQVICNATGREGAWSALDDVILIGGQVGKPLLRVSADGVT